MKRLEREWRAKYVLEGLTLGEFWTRFRPKGDVRITAFYSDGSSKELGKVVCNQRCRGHDGKFYELALKSDLSWNNREVTWSYETWMCFRLSQKIKIIDGGVRIPSWTQRWQDPQVYPVEVFLKFEKELSL